MEGEELVAREGDQDLLLLPAVRESWAAQTTLRSAASYSIRLVAIGPHTTELISVRTIAPRIIGRQLAQRGKRGIDGWRGV